MPLFNILQNIILLVHTRGIMKQITMQDSETDIEPIQIKVEWKILYCLITTKKKIHPQLKPQLKLIIT